MNNNNNKKTISLFTLFVILMATITFCFGLNFGFNSYKTASALSDSDNTSNATSEVVSTLTETSSNADPIIGTEATVLDAVSETANSESSSDIVIPEDIDQRFARGEEVLLPALSTEPKLFTDYRSYNLQRTPHYRLQQAAYTDKDGLRRFGEDYIVALGKYYSESIGDRFQVTLDTGAEFTIIFGDGKAPCDCDDNNMYTPCVNYEGDDCANMLEFIVDDDIMSSKVYAYGSIDYLDKFKGNVVKMVYLGRDNSADWDSYETR